ncbi:MAG: PQQ-binding-like beta-propeller repeat protein [Planctomycetaceae bacterium]|jgi:outer membrane protein assembly factor BamB|nr:PQQ-binding-like beta-propeller repeat protein [Planctomycetaceae bacterium]MBT6154466.1 PQQ-binding-like beta-propeller repeat protein [Planctomycetaceae bacterium]MBT6487277.1 PQQ-binding-like beta-propeller repeat protein [Planctomycetaceae bacterium]
MMPTRTRILLAALLITFFAVGSVRAENWPQFRGPGGRGVSHETDIPLKWSNTENIAWKTNIPGEGWSSPVVFGDRVFVTTATQDGVSCHAICIDRKTGRVLWNTEVVQQTPRKKRRENSYASPTPVADDDRVYVVFGDGSVAALDMDGSVLWTNREIKFYSHHGLGASPILDDGRLIMPFDGSSDGENNRVGWKIPWDKGVVMAYDSETGGVAWRGRRGLSRLAHVTPAVLGTGKSRRILSNAGDVVQAFDPAGGKLLWSVYSKGEGVTPSLITGGGLIFTSSGFEAPTIRAIRPGGKGDVTKTHIAWEQKKGVPTLASLLYLEPHLYAITADGVVACFQGKTGELVSQNRVGGKHWASPIYADGHIYFVNEEGLTTVIKASPKFEIVARNNIPEHTQATPAISQGQIFLRTAGKLYCIGK